MCSVQQGDSCLVFVAIVYWPPKVGLYANGFDEHLQSYGDAFSYKIIMGDFNAGLIEPNAEARALIKFIESTL